MKLLAAAIAIVAGAALAAPQWRMHAAAEPASPAGAMVIVTQATTACFSDMVRVTGIVVPGKTAVVGVDMDGYRVTEVLVFEGDQVTSGQELAHLARQADNMPPGHPAAAAAARLPPSITLRAPAAGLVMRSTARPGLPASPQAGPLFVIVVDNEVEIDVQVPSIHAPKLKYGETARIAIDDGPERSGHVRFVGAEVDPKTQFVRARLSVGSDPAFRVGMFARATIDARRSCGVAIPRAAVDFRTEGTVVQVVRGRRIETRRVTVGLSSDDSIEIRQGLQEGDTVVANAGTSLHDGDQIRPIVAGELDQTRAQ